MAFSGTRLGRFFVPDSVEKIKNFCFYKCNFLYDVVFGSESKLKEIGGNAFEKSRLRILEIPKECKEVAAISLFGVEHVKVSPGNKLFSIKNNFLVKEQKTLIRYFGQEEKAFIGNFAENISEECFWECYSLGEVVFEEGSKMNIISEFAFRFSGLKSICIPNSVKKIR